MQKLRNNYQAVSKISKDRQKKNGPKDQPLKSMITVDPAGVKQWSKYLCNRSLI